MLFALIWGLLRHSAPYAILTESDDGINLTISGDGSINTSAIHELSYKKFAYININDGITKIGSKSFIDCISVIHIKFPTKLEYIGSESFRGCISLINVELPEGLIEIPQDLFESCNKLQSVSFPSTVELINPTFAWYSPLLVSYSISVYNKNYSTIQNGEIITNKNQTIAISCKGSGSLTIPNKIEVLGPYFCYYKSINNIIFEPDSKLRILSGYILYSVDSLKTFNIPPSLERIEEMCFYGSYVVNLSLPSTLVYLSPTAFSRAMGLQNVFVSDECKAIKKIGDIIYSPDETEIIFIPLSISILSISKNLGSIDPTIARSTKSIGAIHVDPMNENYSSYDDALYTKFKDTFMANPYKKTVAYVHENCTAIGKGAFMGTLIEEVYFEGNITTIDNEGFSACVNLMTMEFPLTVTNIGNWVFTNCQRWSAAVTFGPHFYSSRGSSFQGSGITSADFSSSSITIVPSQMFYNCNSLTEVKFPPNCKTIDYMSFYCTGLSKIEVGNKVETINQGAFSGCNRLFEISFVSKSILSTFGIDCFANTNISKISIPSSLTRIESKSFQNCFNLFNITFENESKLKTIAADSFDGCNSLKEVTLPSTIESLNPTSFSICRSLKNIIIGDGQNPGAVYRSVDGAVFSSDGLTLVICPSGREEFDIESNVRWIGQKAFMNCKSLKFLLFGQGSLIESLNSSVFEGCSALSKVIFADDDKVYQRMPGQRRLSQKGSKLKTIGNKVFSGCYSLAEFRFPAGVSVIGASAFEDCSLLKTSLPSGLERIEASGFKDCLSLERVDLGPKVNYIGVDSFVGCKNLIIVTYCGNTSLGLSAFGRDDINCYVLPSYPSESLGGLKVAKLLDSGCNIPTYVFTSDLMRNVDVIFALSLVDSVLCSNKA